MTADLSFTLETNFKQESDKAITALKSLEDATKSAANSSDKSFKSTAQSGTAAITKLKGMASYLETFHKSIPAGQEGMAESLKTMAKNLADSVSQIEAARRRVSVAKGMVNRKDATAEVVNKWTENLKQATAEYNNALAASRGAVEKFYSLMSERDLQRKAAIAADKEDVNFRKRQLAASQAEYDLLYGRQYRDKNANFKGLKADDLLPLSTIKEYQARGVKLGEIDAEFLKHREETAKRARKMVEAATNSPAGEFQKYSSTGQAGAIVTAQEIQAREKYLALRKDMLATGKAIDSKELQQLKEHGAGLTREHLNQVRAFEKLERARAKAPELDPRAAERASALQTYRKYVADSSLIYDQELQRLKAHGVSLKLEHRNQLAAYEKSVEDRRIALRNSATAMLDAAHASPAGIYQQYNSATRRAGSIVEPPAPKAPIQLPIGNKPAEVEKLSKSFRQLTIDGNDAHSMARGLASGFNLLWLTWGNLAPLFAGSAISFGVSRTFSIGMEVEQNIKFLEVLGDKTKEQGSVIREELRKIDQSTLFSLTELSKAMVGLEQGGVSGARGLEVVKVAADLAAVGNTNLDVTSRLLMQTMNLFPQTTADVTKSAAQMFQVTKDGALNIEDIGDAMRYASTSGVLYGQTFEDVLVMQKALAAGGIKGTAAGTSWINFLQDLSGRSKPAVAAMKDLEKALGRTIRTFDDNGKARAALDVLTDIDEALSKFKPEVALKYMNEIFTERGIRQTAAAIRDGTVNLKEYKEELKVVKGEFLTTNAAQLMDTTKGALDILKGTMVGVLDKTFESMGTGFRDTIKNLTSAINSDEFANLMRGMVGSFAALADVAVRVLPVLSNIAAIFIAFKAVSFAQAAVSGLAASMVPLIGYLNLSAGGMVATARSAAVAATNVTGLGTSMLVSAAAAKASAAGLEGTAAAAAVATMRLQATTGVTRILAATMGFLANPIVGLATTLGILGATWWATSQSSQTASEELSAKVWKDGKLNITILDQEIAKIKERDAVRAAGMEAPTTELDSEVERATKAWEKARSARQQVEGKVNPTLSQLTDQRQVDARKKFVEDARTTEAQALANWQALSDRKLDLLSHRAKLEKETEDKRNAGVKAATEKAEADAKRQLSGLDRLGKEGTAQQATQNKLDNDLRYNRLDEIAKANKTELDGLRSRLNSEAEALKDFRDANMVQEGEYQSRITSITIEGEKAQKAAAISGWLSYAAEIDRLLTGLSATPKSQISDNDRANRVQELNAKLLNAAEEFNNDIAKIDEEANKRERRLTTDQYRELDKLRKANETAIANSKDRVQAIRDEQEMADKTLGLGGADLEATQARLKIELEAKKELRKFDLESLDKIQARDRLRADAEAAADDKVWEAKHRRADDFDAQLKVMAEDRTALEVQLQTEAAVAVAAVYRKEFKRRTDELATTLSGALVDTLMNAGKEGGRNLRRTLEQELLAKPFRMVVQALIQPVAQQAAAGINNFLGVPGGSGGNLLQYGSNFLGSSSLFTSSSAYGSILGSAGSQAGMLAAQTSGFAGSQAAMLAAQTGEFGAAGLALTAEAAGTAATAATTAAGAASALATAVPYVAAFVAVASLIESLDDSGTMHTGGLGSYSAARGAATGDVVKAQGLGFDLSSNDYNASAAQASVAIATSVANMLDQTANAFGTKAGYYAATAFADDTSSDGAWGALMVKLGDKIVVDWKNGTDKWPGREFSDGEAGAKEYAAAVAKDMRDYLITQTPDWADQALNALGDSPTLEDLTKTVGQINMAATTMKQAGVEANGLSGWMKRIAGDAPLTGDALQAIAEYPGKLLELAGTSRDALVQKFTEGLLNGEGAMAAGQSVADMLVASIEQSMMGNAAAEVFDIVNRGIVTPMIDAMRAGQTISAALSKASIDAVVAQAVAAAKVWTTVLNSPEFQAAMTEVRSGTAQALGTAFSGANTYVPRYQPPPEASSAASEASSAASDAANDLASEATSLQDRLNAATLTRIQLLAKERATIDPTNQGLFDQVVLAEEHKSIQDELNSLTENRTQAIQRERSAILDGNKVLFDTVNAIKQLTSAVATLDSVGSKFMSGPEWGNYRLARVKDKTNAALGTQFTLEDLQELTVDNLKQMVRAYTLSGAPLEKIDQVLQLGAELIDIKDEIASEYTDLMDRLGVATKSRLQLLEEERDKVQTGNKALFDQVQIAEEAKTLQERLNAATLSKIQLLTLEREAILPANRAMFDLVAAFETLSESKTTLVSSLNEIASEMQSLADTFDGLFESLTKYKGELLSGEAAQLSPQEAYKASKKALTDSMTAVAAGDEKALGNFQELASKFLEDSKGYLASSTGYFSDLDLVKGFTDTAVAAAKRQSDSAIAKKTDAERQLEALGELNNNVLSLADAMRGYAASVATTVSIDLANKLGQIDTDGSGTVQLKELVSKFGTISSEATLAKVFSTLDLNGDKQISLSEAIEGSTATAAAASSNTAASSASTATSTSSVATSTNSSATSSAAIKDNTKATTDKIKSNFWDLDQFGQSAALQWHTDMLWHTVRTTALLEGIYANAAGTASTATAAKAAGTASTATAAITKAPAAVTYSSTLAAAAGSHLAAGGSATAIYDAIKTGGYTLAEAEVLLGAAPGSLALEAAAMGLPVFARGGFHAGGMRLVGENGPELEVTGASRIYSAQQTRDLLSNYSGQSDNSELVAELRALRAEVAELKQHAAANVRVAQAVGKAQIETLEVIADASTDSAKSQRLMELAR